MSTAPQSPISKEHDEADRPPHVGSAEAYYAAFIGHTREIRRSTTESLDGFSRVIHASLNPTEIAYLVANEGRHLIGCDRLAVGLRRGKHVAVEAVSGVDVVEKRANVIQRMRDLFRAVVEWGEVLIYNGARDDALPQTVLDALDNYLAVCPCRFLVLEPCRDEREQSSTDAPRSALLLECFHPIAAPDSMCVGLQAVANQCAGAFYNALEFENIPMKWVWHRLARTKTGLRGARLRWALAALVTTAIIVLLMVIPYPFKVEAHGQLLPELRRWVYAPVEGRVVHFEESLRAGSVVAANQSLILMHDVQLEMRMVQLAGEISGAQQAVDALSLQEAQATAEAERLRLSVEKKQKEFIRDRKILERRALRDRVHADETRPGYFWVKAPLAGTILNSNFRETFTNRHVKPSEPLVRIGDKTRTWEVELRIPQDCIAPVIRALHPADAPVDLDVDLQLKSLPTKSFQGKLSADRITSHANLDRDNSGDTSPTVRAVLRIDGSDISATDAIPSQLLIAGTEVRARVNCGSRPLGYVLFHGVWEYFHKLVF